MPHQGQGGEAAGITLTPCIWLLHFLEYVFCTLAWLPAESPGAACRVSGCGEARPGLEGHRRRSGAWGRPGGLAGACACRESQFNSSTINKNRRREPSSKQNLTCQLAAECNVLPKMNTADQTALIIRKASKILRGIFSLVQMSVGKPLMSNSTARAY